MATFNLKKLKMPKLTMENLLLAGAVVALVYALRNYSGHKTLNVEGNENGSAPQKQAAVGGIPQNGNYAPVNGVVGSESQVPSVNQHPVTDPKDLLPKDSNSSWTNQPAGDGLDVSLVKAGHHIGTVGQTLRNANLQLRSEPANPQAAVGPWNQTTIAPDNQRRDLEIGA